MNTSVEQRFTNLLRELETLVGQELADLALQALDAADAPATQHAPVFELGSTGLPGWRIARAVEELDTLATNLHAAADARDRGAWLKYHGLPNPTRPDPLLAWLAMIPSLTSASPKLILAGATDALSGMLSNSSPDKASEWAPFSNATIHRTARYLRIRQAQRVWQQSTLVTAQGLFAHALNRMDDPRRSRSDDLCSLFPIWSRCQALAVQTTAVPNADDIESDTAQTAHNSAQAQSDLVPGAPVEPVSRRARIPNPLPGGRSTLPTRFHDGLAALLNAMVAAPALTPITTPRRAHWTQHGATLYRYETLAGANAAPALLLVSGWRHRSAVLDLEPDLSLVNALQGHHIDVWGLEWADPELSLRPRTIENCLRDVLSPAIECIAQLTGSPFTLLGVGETGVLALCQAALQSEALSGVIVEGGGLGLDPTWPALVRWLPLDNWPTQVPYLPGTVLGALEHSLLGCGEDLSAVMVKLMASERPDSAQSFARMVYWTLDRSSLDPQLLLEYRDAFMPAPEVPRKPVMVAGTSIDPSALRTPILNLICAGPAHEPREPPGWNFESERFTYRELSTPDGGLEAIAMSTASVRSQFARDIAEWLWALECHTTVTRP